MFKRMSSQRIETMYARSLMYSNLSERDITIANVLFTFKNMICITSEPTTTF